MNIEIPVELRKWQHLCWTIAEDHGWHEKDPLHDKQGNINFSNIAVELAMIHSEVSEALEAARVGDVGPHYNDAKPKGLIIELADVVIRILDTVHSLGYDMQKAMEIKTKYNMDRPYRHGNKNF